MVFLSEYSVDARIIYTVINKMKYIISNINFLSSNKKKTALFINHITLNI